MRWLLVLFLVFVTACGAPSSPPTGQSAARKPPSQPTQADMQRFATIVRRVEPVAERVCRQNLRQGPCDFKIVVDDRPNQPPNAFQTLDKDGTPILAFNLALIADVRNEDELAFVMGHEAAHHIAGHIPQMQGNAMAGALIFGTLASITGAGSSGVDAAVDIGATVGARAYSKDFELEADALGTVITKQAGYDPVRGAEFFTQIPDPGNRFLGTHPPNAQRIETVRRVNAGL
jgi:Zn-dependent protease with chaperone function